jgi:hypothetical protein
LYKFPFLIRGLDMTEKEIPEIVDYYGVERYLQCYRELLEHFCNYADSIKDILGYECR